ncbi:MAG: hypothetical protein E6Q33_02215 [Neisseriales bacterium]|jgi:predicted heme/steroid binding protein|nr:MAG: hypothetical protein E6Q33_02215 [Neisseriales bacterium]
MQKIKIGLLGVLLSGGILVANAAPTTPQLPTMNAATLKNYDGKDGHKAYVALNGYVYDVSNVSAWKGGKHYKGMVAGTDLTSHIDESPHGPNVVKQLKLKPVAIYK